MAQHDLTITDAQYAQMMAVLDAMRARIAPLRMPLAKMMASQPGKVRAFIQTEDGRLLREVFRLYRDLHEFARDVGYEVD